MMISGSYSPNLSLTGSDRVGAIERDMSLDIPMLSTGLIRQTGSGFVAEWLVGSVEDFAAIGIQVPTECGDYEDYKMTKFNSGSIGWAGVYYVDYVVCEPETELAPNSKSVIAGRRMGTPVYVQFEATGN